MFTPSPPPPLVSSGRRVPVHSTGEISTDVRTELRANISTNFNSLAATVRLLFPSQEWNCSPDSSRHYRLGVSQVQKPSSREVSASKQSASWSLPPIFLFFLSKPFPLVIIISFICTEYFGEYILRGINIPYIQ